MRYWLMRKNERITILDFSEDGVLLKYAQEVLNNDIAPLEYKVNKNDWIKKWWSERQIPLRQGTVEEMLRRSSLIGPDEYLLSNLGLSLNDYYWICPFDEKLRWEDVNLYDNEFKENLLVKLDERAGYKRSGKTSSFTPNGSLQGQLEKTWQIKDDRRIMVKGNSDDLSCESLNEVFASLLHEKQGYDNYVSYKLIKIRNRSYAYGCVCDCFTNQDCELVTAWALLTSGKNNKSLNDYENLISIAAAYGIDETQFRRDLEYQIMTDYILSNRDRHMNNIGVLRDAKTLKLIRMAPIYDSGRSMFVRRYDLTRSQIVDGDVNSFFNKEKKLLSLVRDKSLVDVSRLPDVNDLVKLYKKEPRLSAERIKRVCEYYEQKVNEFISWQKK